MNYLHAGFSQSVAAIKKRKGLFVFIILLQVLFLVSSLWLTSVYWVKIIDHAKGVIQPLENANYNADKIKAGEPFTGEVLPIYSSYQAMLTDLIYFTVWISILFVILNGGLWLSSSWLFEEKKDWKTAFRQKFRFFLKIVTSLIVVLIPSAIAAYYILLHFVRISESFDNIIFIMKILLVGLAVLYYFLLVAFAIATIASWKQFVKSWFKVSIRKIGKTFPLFILVSLILAASIAAVYAAVEYEQSLMLVLAAGLLIIIVLVVTRIFWIAGIQQIRKEIE